MYHPYQHLVAKRIMKERREIADMARRVEQTRGDRANLLSSLRAKLVFLVDRFNNQASIPEDVARKERIDARVLGLADE